MTIEISRRAFARTLGGSMGAAGLRRTLGAMGLLPTSTAYAKPPPLPPDAGAGRNVLILGAGIAGMVAGYRLSKAGFACTILEARNRAGGRVWTLRGGDRIVERQFTSPDADSSVQDVQWDRQQSHLYLNAGASRISHHHQGMLDICREFDIHLEPFISDNRAGLWHSDYAFAGKPQLLSQVIVDGRGWLAALAAKAAPDDVEGLRAFIKAFGQLKDDPAVPGGLTYAGSGWAGYKHLPGGGNQGGEPFSPLPLAEIVQAVKDPRTNPRYRNPLIAMLLSENWDQAPTMLQPVGGMDKVTDALAHALGNIIKFEAEVLRIERSGDYGRVVWRETKTGRVLTIEAEIVICTLPLTVLQDIPAQFSAGVSAAISEGAKRYVPAAKVGFLSDDRWWEKDYGLYGGASWTSRDITQVWYPSHGFHKKNGILVGAYLWDDLGTDFARKTVQQRLQTAVADGEVLHPGYASLVKEGIALAWPNIPFTRGGWCEWGDRKKGYPDLVAGDGPFYFAGEHVSYIPGWQEGAVQSAYYVLEQIKTKLEKRP